MNLFLHLRLPKFNFSGSSHLRWKSDIDSHLQDKIGLFYFSSSFWGFFPLLQAISTFPRERMMLEKERSSRMYRLSSYFISRTTSDVPMELVLPTIFILIIYWMAGLKRSATIFFATLFSQLLSVLVSQGFGLAVGALVLDQTSATHTWISHRALLPSNIRLFCPTCASVYCLD